MVLPPCADSHGPPLPRCLQPLQQAGPGPKATVGFADSSGTYVCLYIKSASVRDVEAFIGGILPLQAHHRIRLALTPDVMFHVGCLRQALATLWVKSATVRLSRATHLDGSSLVAKPQRPSDSLPAPKSREPCLFQ
jgi:hypothetical protein